MAEFKYEQALKQLEAIVEALDGADIPLEERLKKFEEGTKLARQLMKRLEQVQKKVEILVGTSGEEAVFEAFQAEEAEDEPEGGDA
jgi:exodeoxyribonuclease VII small subunit